MRVPIIAGILAGILFYVVAVVGTFWAQGEQDARCVRAGKHVAADGRCIFIDRAEAVP